MWPMDRFTDAPNTYGLPESFPELWRRAKEADDRERLGLRVTANQDEAARAMLELWVARGNAPSVSAGPSSVRLSDTQAGHGRWLSAAETEQVREVLDGLWEFVVMVPCSDCGLPDPERYARNCVTCDRGAALIAVTRAALAVLAVLGEPELDRSLSPKLSESSDGALFTPIEMKRYGAGWFSRRRRQ